MICANCSLTLFDFLHASAHLFGEFVHPHYTGRNRRLHLLYQLFDIVTGYSSLVGQTPNLGSDNNEPAAMLACLFRFDGRIEREQIRLVCDLGDGGHDLINVTGFFIQHRQLGINCPPASITCRMVASMRAKPF